MATEAANKIIEGHKSNGKIVSVNGVNTFYFDVGSGPVVFCIHGVPTSSFLYRKVGKSLAERGTRTIAIDLPGLGLSDRPEEFDYTFSSLGNFCNDFLDKLEINEIHLVIHDIGAPIGLGMAAQKPDRVVSITVLNAMLDIENFVKPLPMRPFEKPVLGEAELAMLTPVTFPMMMKTAGIVDTGVISHDEMAAYIHLLKREDNGRAFLKIMRSFEQTRQFSEVCYSAFTNTKYPAQLIWGDKDPFLDFENFGSQFVNARPGIEVTKANSRHFLQEEAHETIALRVDEMVKHCYQSHDKR